MKCCTSFFPRKIYNLKSPTSEEKIMQIGFCPKCGCFIVEVITKTYDGRTRLEIYKRKKAIRFYEANKHSITSEYISGVKYGNKSNMAFKYGLNVETKDGIKQYAVDFNGTKELITK